MSEGTDADILRVSVPVAQVSNVVTGCRRLLVSDVVVLLEQPVSRVGSVPCGRMSQCRRIVLGTSFPPFAFRGRLALSTLSVACRLVRRQPLATMTSFSYRPSSRQCC